jgi:hypothetical protein
MSSIKSQFSQLYKKRAKKVVDLIWKWAIIQLKSQTHVEAVQPFVYPTRNVLFVILSPNISY